MAIDVIQPNRSEDRSPGPNRRRLVPERDISDLTAAGVQAYVRSAAQDSVHLERRGGRTYLVVDDNIESESTGLEWAR